MFLLVAYNVLASGLLSGKYDENSKFNESDRRSRLESFSEINMKKNISKLKELRKLSELENSSILEHSLKWISRNKSVQFAITGIKNKQQIEENIIAFN